MREPQELLLVGLGGITHWHLIAHYARTPQRHWWCGTKCAFTNLPPRRVVISGVRKISIKCTKVQSFGADIIALSSSMVKKSLPSTITWSQLAKSNFHCEGQTAWLAALAPIKTSHTSIFELLLASAIMGGWYMCWSFHKLQCFTPV